MAASAPVSGHPVRVFEAAVAEVRDLSPHFRRITLAGASLLAFGVPGPTLDLRIKMLLPVPGHDLQLPGTPEGLLHPGWYQDWLRQEQPGRGFIRSYTVRALRRAAGTEVDIDVVLHEGPAGHDGPGASWARSAVAGRRAWFVGPALDAVTTATPLPEAGINWRPGNAKRVLLAGDETAVPAISSILEHLPAGITGEAFLEVPSAADVQPLQSASGLRITWLDRADGSVPRGQRLAASLRSAGMPDGGTSTYAWIGAEAGVVKELRQYLVACGVDPKTSEFRGYWSLGKAGSGVNGVPVSRQG